jgi:predicted NBD/HSP70 family sugar kinase
MRMYGTEDSAHGGPLSAGHVLQMIRDAELSRADIARLTGLARSTVSQRVEALLDLGLVAEEGDTRSTGGRPATRLRLNRNGGVVLAADLGANHDRIIATDLEGTVLAERTAAQPIASGPEVILGWARDNFLEMLNELGRNPSEVLGIGVGVPGPVEFAAGRAVNPPIMPGWHAVSLIDFFADTFPGVDVLVDNDVNIMAVGEYQTHWKRKVSDLLFIKVATGIGAGIIAGGKLQRGAQGAAGDIGHIRASEYLDTVCSCGNQGCIEAVASGSALAARLRKEGHETHTTMDVIELVGRGDPDAVRLVREAGRLLGEVLASAVNLLNPSVLVVGGDLAKAQQQLFAGMREAIYRRSSSLATGHLEIMHTRLEDRGGVIGAASIVLDQRLSPDAVDRQISVRGAA